MAPEHLETTGPRFSRSRRSLGTAALLVGLAGWATWIVWRIETLHAHPIPIIMLSIELSGVACGAAVTLGLLGAGAPRDVVAIDPRDSHRYAFVVADDVGSTRSADLHRDMRSVVDRLWARELAGSSDRTVLAVMTDGPRRIASVVVLTIALLAGVAPVPMPGIWPVVALVAGAVGIAASHVVLTGGRIRFGDRTRWSFASLGEVLAPNDPAGIAPRRWVGTVGAVVTLSLAIGLRGISDHWTHGLPVMSDADRVAAMLMAMIAVAGALFTLRTMPTPAPADGASPARRLEEPSARRSALGAAVCVGVIGLVAGVLPAGIDAADGDTPRVETLTDSEVVARD